MGPKKFLVATLTTIYGASNKYAGLDAVNWTDTIFLRFPNGDYGLGLVDYRNGNPKN